MTCENQMARRRNREVFGQSLNNAQEERNPRIHEKSPITIGALLGRRWTPLFAAACLACGATNPAKPAVVAGQDPPPSTTKEATDPFRLPSDLRAELAPKESLKQPNLVAWKSTKSIPGVAEPTAACKELAAKPLPACTAKPTFDALASAWLANDDSLRALESCSYPVGLVRSLRAEREPSCGDTLTEKLIETRPKGLSNDTLHVLVGQSIGARLMRTGGNAPKLSGEASKERVKAFLKDELAPYFKQQFDAIRALSAVAISLDGYGLGIGAVEAGHAEMRFVESARNQPLPNEWKNDEELAHVYYGVIEEMLQPSLTRGRDAALVGLGQCAIVGEWRSERVSRTRTLLSRMYAGRRIDALDALFYPGDMSRDSLNTQSSLPAFYANAIVPEVRHDPTSHKEAIERLVRGATFWRGTEYDRVIAGLHSKIGESGEARFDVALALALREGPVDALRMMLAPSPSALQLRRTEALDAITKAGGPHADVAAFDAALLWETSPPDDANAAYFREVAGRYRNAANLAHEGKLKTAALDRAQHLDEIAAKLR